MPVWCNNLSHLQTCEVVIPCLAAGIPHGIIMIQTLSWGLLPQGCFIFPAEITSWGNTRRLLTKNALTVLFFLYTVGVLMLVLARFEPVVNLIKLIVTLWLERSLHTTKLQASAYTQSLLQIKIKYRTIEFSNTLSIMHVKPRDHRILYTNE